MSSKNTCSDVEYLNTISQNTITRMDTAKKLFRQHTIFTKSTQPCSWGANHYAAVYVMCYQCPF